MIGELRLLLANLINLLLIIFHNPASHGIDLQFGFATVGLFDVELIGRVSVRLDLILRFNDFAGVGLKRCLLSLFQADFCLGFEG